MSPELTDALVTLLGALLGVLTLMARLYVVPWITSQAHGQQIDNARVIAGHAVEAVEQVATQAGWSNDIRREKAIAWAQDAAAAHGVALSDEQMATLVEAAVRALKVFGTAADPAAAAPAATTAKRRLPPRDAQGHFVSMKQED